MEILNKAIRYAENVIAGKEITTKEVVIQCHWFLKDLERQEDENFRFYFDENELKKINSLLKLMNFATGLIKEGTSVIDGMADFQAFFLVNVFGWRHKDNPKKFRYYKNVLFIPRKNAKTFIVAIIIIILMLTEQKNSEFYSICLDRGLAGEVKKAITQIITASPALTKHFKMSKTLSGKIECKFNGSYFQARTAEADRNNSIRPSAKLYWHTK